MLFFVIATYNIRYTLPINKAKVKLFCETMKFSSKKDFITRTIYHKSHGIVKKASQLLAQPRFSL